MIGEQPQITAPMTDDRPTPPAPKTAIDELGSGRRTLMTPPAPVCTPQPNGATTSKGTSSGMATTLVSAMTAPVAKHDCPKKCECTGVPSRVIAVVPSVRVARKLRSKNSAQWNGWPLAHIRQPPHEPYVQATWSPTLTRVTAAPTSSTTPAPSWPRTTGIGVGKLPSRMSRSVWQIPEATIRTRTSSDCRAPSSRRSRANGAPPDSTTAAVMAEALIDQTSCLGSVG
jgi:hypothetical protein